MNKLYPALLVALVGFVSNSFTVQAQTTTLRFAKLITGQGDVIVDPVIIIEGNKIIKVSAGEKNIPANTTLVDLRPLTAIPGLIDVHTHMTYFWDRAPGTNPWASRLDPATTVFLAQENALKTLSGCHCTKFRK